MLQNIRRSFPWCLRPDAANGIRFIDSPKYDGDLVASSNVHPYSTLLNLNITFIYDATDTSTDGNHRRAGNNG